MDPGRLHTELLALAVDIVGLRAEQSAIELRLQKAIERHKALIAAATDQDDQTHGNGAALLMRSDQPRIARILAALADSGSPLNSREIAKRLGDERKTIYLALQDMKRRKGFVSGPEDGRWKVTDAGLENLAARAKEA